MMPEPVSLAEVKSNKSNWFPIPLDNYLNTMYTAEVTFGAGKEGLHRAAKLRLIIDTGSSDLWTSGKAMMHYHHWPEAMDLGDLIIVEYGKGTIAGMYVKDSLCLSSRLCIDHQSMLIALKISEIGAAKSFDGLLGLGFPKLEKLNCQGGCEPVLDNLVGSGRFKHMAFALALRGQRMTFEKSYDLFGQEHFEPKQDKTTDQSFIVFGEVDELIEEAKRETGQSAGAVVPVLELETRKRVMFWIVKESHAYWWLIRFEVAFQSGQMFKGEVGALDSGTSVLTAPSSVYKALLANLTEGLGESCMKMEAVFAHYNMSTPAGARGIVMCYCNATLNPVTFTFKDKQGGPSLNINLTSADLLSPISPGLCMLSIMESPKKMPFWLLGDTLLRNLYAVHDYEGEKLHLFARKQDQHSGRVQSNPPQTLQANDDEPQFKDEFHLRSDLHKLREPSDVQAPSGVMVLVGCAIIAGVILASKLRRSGGTSGSSSAAEYARL